tara:strand:+ start:7191 stop:7772 length:582 start_codon:yes stop_codon:yes gene_type:complete
MKLHKKINFKKINFKKIIFIIIVYLIYINLFKGYIPYLPTIPIYSNTEVSKVKKIISKRTQNDIDFFYLTNDSVSNAFLPYVDETKNDLDKIVMSHNFIIFFFKYLINRPRPEQIDNSIKPVNKKTAMTPAYPAGHSYQAYLLSKHLSKKYPEKKNLFKNLAMKCDDCRVKAGLHYPSDGEFSRKLVDMFSLI